MSNEKSESDLLTWMQSRLTILSSICLPKILTFSPLTLTVVSHQKALSNGFRFTGNFVNFKCSKVVFKINDKVSVHLPEFGFKDSHITCLKPRINPGFENVLSGLG